MDIPSHACPTEWAYNKCYSSSTCHNSLLILFYFLSSALVKMAFTIMFPLLMITQDLPGYILKTKLELLLFLSNLKLLLNCALQTDWGENSDLSQNILLIWVLFTDLHVLILITKMFCREKAMPHGKIGSHLTESCFYASHILGSCLYYSYLS